MFYKVCKYCGKQYEVGTQCSCGRKQEHEERYKKSKFRRERKAKIEYSNRTWKRVRDYIYQRAGGLDEYMLSLGIIVPGEIVHHIVEVEEDKSKVYEVDNLILVSRRTHAMIHKEYNANEMRKNAMVSRLFSIVKGRVKK